MAAQGGWHRSRPVYLGLLGATVALGLATRRFPAAFPDVVARYGGDALWAVMILWLGALVRPVAATSRLALAAFGICTAVEFSQLAHAPWIDAVRATRGGALVLGQGFLWSDLVSYAVGVASAALIDSRLRAADRWIPRLSRDRIIRSALWATVALNLLGVIVFAPPAFGRASALLPIAVPPFFALTRAYALAGAVPMGMAINATPDLLFAAIFLWWARTAA